MNLYQPLDVRGRELIVYLPPSYDQSAGRHYPVAYVQDQGEPFQECLNYLEHSFRAGELQEAILVGISTDDRNREYTPWPAKALLEGRPPFGGEGRVYVDEVADVIKPYIDSRYRTLIGPEHTAIIGGSLGGLISLFAGYWRHDIFGRIGMLSGSLWYEGVLDYIRDQGGLPNSIKLFMSVGQNEGIYKQNAQRYMFPYHLEAHRHWLGNGADEQRRLRLIVDPNGTHDPIFMYKYFTEALKWLFEAAGEAVVQTPAEGGYENRRGSSETVSTTAENPPLFHIPGTVTWSMRSELTGREYRIFIVEPMGQPPKDGYPVLYSLDANAIFGSLAEAIRIQTRTPRGIPPALIVGIGFDSEEPIASDERFYNYAEYADIWELPSRPNGMKWPETGGVESFLTFIEEQLKPKVEANYYIDRDRQTLFGHSLGGYFALYTLFTRPEVFQRYFAASPSIWWKNHALHNRWEEGRSVLEQIVPLRELHLYVGSEEKPSMVEDARELYTLLKEHEKALKTVFHVIDGEGHVSVLPSLISPLLRLLIAPSETS